MQNNKDANKDNASVFQEIPDEKGEPLFDEQTIKSSVQGFILAFVSGRVKIDYPNKEQIEWLMHTMDKAGDTKFEKLDKKSQKEIAIYHEMRAQQELNDLIGVCCGTKQATSVERKKAFNELFHKILAYRSGGRIVGEFVNYDIAERVERLEQGIEKINDLLKQLVDIHRAEMGL